MPYRTKYGKHYHMEENCHGATIPCDTKGLEPCSDCCGTKGEGSGGMAVSGSGSGGGMPVSSGEAGSFDAGAANGMEAGAGGDQGGNGQEEDKPMAQSAKELSDDGSQCVRDGMDAPEVTEEEVAESLPEMMAERQAHALVARIDELDEQRRELAQETLQRITEDRNRLQMFLNMYSEGAESVASYALQTEVMRDFEDWRGRAMADDEIRERALEHARKAVDKEAAAKSLTPAEREARLQEHFDLAVSQLYARFKEEPPHGLALVEYLSAEAFARALALHRLPDYEQRTKVASYEAERHWSAQLPLEHPEAAVQLFLEMNDARDIAEETFRHARGNRAALNAATIEGDPEITEHDGVSYTMVDGAKVARSCVPDTGSKGNAESQQASGGQHGHSIECTKMARVRARPAQEGEEIVSWAGDGTKEAVASGKAGSYILTKLDADGNVMLDENGHPNEWQVSSDQMKKRYEMGEIGVDGSFVAMTRPAVTQVMRVDRDVVIMVPWGEGGALVPQYIRKGGYLNVTDPNDVYGISEQDFNDTYRRGDGIQHIPSLP